MSAGGLRSILVTPNFVGADGVSALSREIARALPPPTAVLSLHDAGVASGDLPTDLEMYGAGGNRARFLAAVAATSLRCSSATEIVCSHLHLAPAAAMLAWRGGHLTIVLCGIEAWVPLRTAEVWALDRAALVAISHHTVGRFKEVNPMFASTDVVVCHPGVPESPSRRSHGARAGGSAALIVARMSAAERYKGHDALLDLWPGLLAHRPDARLMIAGDGDDRHRLESRAQSLGLSHAVSFAGRVSDARLHELYDECRFLVMPSRDEGFGLVFLEAMRAGKSCIGGRGAAAEIIDDNVTGLIVDPGSPGSSLELAAAVCRLFDEPDTCCRFGAAGRERFLSTFTDVRFQSRFVQAMERRPATL
jgi:phosphatidylinositol alpha-1,6-mannosyltransferase